MISGCQRYIVEVRDVGTFIRDARDTRDARTRALFVYVWAYCTWPGTMYDFLGGVLLFYFAISARFTLPAHSAALVCPPITQFPTTSQPPANLSSPLPAQGTRSKQQWQNHLHHSN